MRKSIWVLLFAVLMLATLASPRAQRGRRGGGDSDLMLSTNTILQNPDAYIGKPVSLSAGVEQVLSKTVFLVDQRRVVGPTEVKAIGKPILVIAPTLNGTLDPKHYLLMRGQLMKFDTMSIGKAAAGYTLDIDPEVSAKFKGQPVLLATSVINSVYVDLAKKPLPPPSPAEISLSKAMKTVNPSFTALRAAIQDSKMDVVKENVARLGPAFTDVEGVWEGLGQIGAAEWAREAKNNVAAIERAAAAGNWDNVKLASGELNLTCTRCHSVYREREDDGTFRITPGTY